MQITAKLFPICFSLLILLSASSAQDVFTYPGCADVSRNDFIKTTFVDKVKDPTLDEPIRFAIADDGAVYFSERNGTIKVAKKDGTIAKVGRINVNPVSAKLKIGGNNEFGLVGLALDPGFAANGFIYVSYQAASPDITNLSRFTLVNGVLDGNSEKVLLSWPIQKNYCCHTGGGMQFDAKGDLWVSVGNNTRNPPVTGDAGTTGYVDEANPDADDQGHAANSNDYRGKILRIHPTPDGKYSLPAGNLKDAYASLWTPEEAKKVKPEIYTMGHRSPFTLAVDDVQGLLSWGEIGPDDHWDTEELNIVNGPGFMGWPYFAGAAANDHYRYKLAKDPAAPVNTSKNNTGVQKLPPAKEAAIGYRESAAITGPVYRYSARQASGKKLPAHFDGKWIISDWNAGWLHIAGLDKTGTKVTEVRSLLSGLIRPLQVTVGPDGVLYVLEYATGYKFNGDGTTTPGNGSDGATRISRLEYTGAPCAATVSLKDRMFVASQKGKTALVRLGPEGERSLALPFGAKGFRLYDLRGKLVWDANGIDSRDPAGGRAEIPASVGEGLFRAAFAF